MFHHLPGEQRPEIEAMIAQACRGRVPSPFAVTGVRFLGRGSAYTLSMPNVADLRRQLAQAWSGNLTRQDQQAWQPHVTVQNKAASGDAKRLFATLREGFVPFKGDAIGLGLWHYLGGPLAKTIPASFSTHDC